MKVFTPAGMEADAKALEQLETCLRDERAVDGALMADHHLGYSMPIGGVVAYDNAISPSGVGFDIACGNKAALTPLTADELGDVRQIMRQVQRVVEFGIGRTNATPLDHPLFDEHKETLAELDRQAKGLEHKARQQLGTVGSGNHYVDLLADEQDRVWVANHFGSRGLGHTIATGFLNLAAGQPFDFRGKERDEPTVIPLDTELGQAYLAAMRLAGDYAYAGRDYVIEQVLGVLGTQAVQEVHNHHNFAWEENGKWVVRKGATPLTRDLAFIGGSMGDGAVIVRGTGDDIGNLASAPHGSGRVMSRTKAAGKLTKMWYCNNRNCSFKPERAAGNNSPYQKNRCPNCGLPLRKGRMRDRSTAVVDWRRVQDDLAARGIVVLGSGADEAPEVYKRLDDVLAAHPNIEIVHRLRPLGVVMAGDDVFDPYKD
jgi:tRNA-splicing ligase RtcB (3'-phosphate/5'-hydroxy nucleic acid ligase)